MADVLRSRAPLVALVAFSVISSANSASALDSTGAALLVCGSGTDRALALTEPGGEPTFVLDPYGEVTRRDAGPEPFRFAVRARAGGATPTNLIARVEVLRGGTGAPLAVYCGEVVIDRVYGLAADLVVRPSDRAVVTLFGAPTGDFLTARAASATRARTEAIATAPTDPPDLRAAIVVGRDIRAELLAAAGIARDVRGGTATSDQRAAAATPLRTADVAAVCAAARRTPSALADRACAEAAQVAALLQQLATHVESGSADEIEASLALLVPQDDRVTRICERVQMLRWLRNATDLRPLARHELPAANVEPVVVDYDSGSSEPDRPAGDDLLVVLRGAPVTGRLWAATREHESSEQEALENLGRLLGAVIGLENLAFGEATFCESEVHARIDAAYPVLVPFGARTLHVGELSDDGVDVAICNDAACPARADGDNVRNFLDIDGEHDLFSWTIMAGLTVSFAAEERLAQTFGSPEFQLDSITVDPAMDPMDPTATETNQHFVVATPYSAADLFAATLLIAVRWQPEPDGVTFMLGTGPGLSLGAARFQWNVVAGIGVSHGAFFVLGLGLRTSRVARGTVSTLTVPLGEDAPSVDASESVAALGTVGFAIDLEGLGDVGNEIVKAFGGGE